MHLLHVLVRIDHLEVSQVCDETLLVHAVRRAVRVEARLLLLLLLLVSSTDHVPSFFTYRSLIVRAFFSEILAAVALCGLGGNDRCG